MRNMVCKSIRMIATALAVIFAVSGCDKPFELSYPLNVTQRNITLKKGGGSTHVLVYSTGKWNAHFVQPVSWASLDRDGGYGNSEFVFDYSPNYGVARKVQIALETSESRDTVTMVQTGSITEVSFIPEYRNIILVRQAATVCIPISSNVRYGLEAMKSSVQYEDEFCEPWIDDVRVTPDFLYFSVKDNPDDISRKAWITLLLPDETGATTNLVTCRLTVTQTKDSPALALKQTSVSLDASARTVTVQTSKNNIWPYASSLKVDIQVQSGINDWLGNVRLTQDGLMFDVSKNTTGQSRQGSIDISFEASDGSKVSAKCLVSQSSEL